MTADADAWGCLLSVDTPWSAVDGIVKRQCRIALEEVRAQLHAQTAWNEDELERALRLAEPFIHARWRLVIETGWWELQRLAGRVQH